MLVFSLILISWNLILDFDFDLDCYLKDVSQGIVSFVDNPEIIKESPATALVDGMNLLGFYFSKGLNIVIYYKLIIKVQLLAITACK